MNGPSRLRAAMMTALLSAVVGCDTRVIDLDVPDSGVIAPGADSCESVKRADGSVCRVCFLPDGNVLNRGCTPPPPAPGEPPAPPGAPATGGECKVDSGGKRCLLCTRGGVMYSPCLVCDAPTVTSRAGDTCQGCRWTDAAERGCLRCFAADGKVISDDCDSLRPERLFP